MFVGRQKELKLLETIAKKEKASLVVIKGRRRIGKTTLIEEFAKDKPFYRFSGLAPSKDITTKDQKENFLNDFYRYFNIKIESDNWFDLFIALDKLVPDQQTIIFFDEISWLAGSDHTFLPKLKEAWDRYFSKKRHLVFILCGSVSVWIEKHILLSTGFVGRISHVLKLEELPLYECTKFWKTYTHHISVYEKLKLLSVTGGIPRYLEEIEPYLTAEENIKRLCFQPDGFLFNEFNRIFHDVLTANSRVYKLIVESLIFGAKSMKEICTTLNIEMNNTISGYLDELVEAGFLSRDYTWSIKQGKQSKLSKYRIRDNYLRFYLKYVEPHQLMIERGDYQNISLANLPKWPTIMGFQFENLVIQQRNRIIELLGEYRENIVYDNPFFQAPRTNRKGCQIDYLIQTKANQLYVCEIKFSQNTIGKQVIHEVEDKIKRLSLPRGFSYRTVLIHVNGIDEALKEEQYFAHIIDFGTLLAAPHPMN